MLFLISILSFFLPTQLGLHLDYWNSSVYGFKIDYLIPTVYLTDLLALTIIALGLKQIKIKRRNVLFLLSFVIFAFINIFVSDYFVASLYKWVKVFEMIGLFCVLKDNPKINPLKHIIIPLSLSILLISFLGVLQYFNKGSIGGLFYFLGERNLRFSDSNVAPFPYSTFSHPNAFAGFLLVFQLIFIQFKNKLKKFYFWLVTLFVVVNIILTNSLNVYVAIFCLLLINLSRGFNLIFLSYDFTQRFIAHRLELMSAAFKIIKTHLIFGAGLNNFIPNLVKVSNTFINAWELQPVHNIFLLVLSEVGIVGFILFCLSLYTFFLPNSYPLFAIIFTGMSDHYWLTLQQNILLFVYVLALSKK